MREADSAFGDPTMFLEQAVAAPASHRGADPRRRRRARPCTCSSATARCSAATRRSSRSRRRPNLDEDDPPGAVPRRDRVREVDRLRQRRHRRVPARHRGRARGPARLHRDEPAHPGRAHGDRGGHRRRPRAVADAHRRGRDASPTSASRRTSIQLRGAALQCRITTEDPAAGFRPDTGKITTYRSPGGAGIRLDGGTDQPGRADQPALRLDAREDDRAAAATSRRPSPAPGAGSPSSASAASPPTSRSCRPCSTTRRSSRATSAPRSSTSGRSCVHGRASRRTAAPRSSTGSPTSRSTSRTAPAPASSTRPTSCPTIDLDAPAPAGSRQRLLELGPAGFAAALRAQTAARGHRDDLPRRPPVAARHPRAHHATSSRSLPHVARLTPAAAVGRGVGRRDLRRRAALPRRGPVGAARRAARGAAEHRHPDAAARPQHRRLHAVPDRGDRRVRARGRSDRRRHLPHLRRPQRRRPDAPGDRRRARDRARRRRGRPLLHGRPARPRRGPLHARLLPAPRRADRRRRRAHPRHQGHGGAAARRRPPRSSSAALRERFDLPVHVHTHDTAGRPARDAARREPRGRRRGRRRERADGRHHEPALGLRPRRRARAHRARHGHLAAGGRATSSRTGRPCAASTSPFESGLPGPTGPRLPPRDPRRPALEPAPAGDRARPRPTSSRRSRTCTRRRTASSGASAEGHAVVEGRRRPRPAPRRRERRPGRLRGRTPRSTTSPTRSSASWPASSATCPAAGPSRSAPRCSRAATCKIGVTELTPDEQRRTRGRQPPTRRVDAQPRCCSRRRPASSSRSASCSATSPSSTPPTTSTACSQGVEHVVEIDKGVRLYVGLEAIGEADDKGMRTVMTTLNGQLRPVFVRDRSITVETQGGREGRRQPSPARSPRRSRASSPCRSRRAPTVEAGQAVASIEAMKMEAAITRPVAGVVERARHPEDAAGGGRRSARRGAAASRLLRARTDQEAYRCLTTTGMTHGHDTPCGDRLARARSDRDASSRRRVRHAARRFPTA